jgi:hypothetical protein
VRNSGTRTRNPGLVDWSETFQNRDNLEFFAAALDGFATHGIGNGGLMTVGLIGQRDLPGVTLRQAQSVLRWDLRPSLWSHAFLLAETVDPESERVASAPVLEVTLHPRTGDFPRPEWNGVNLGPLARYRDWRVDANVALLAVHMTDDEARLVAERARDFNVDRVRYNLWEMLGVWQGYLWSHGQRPNPLNEGIPVFSAAYVEMAFEAIGLDVTPAASERNSAPEHVWNAAVWWHDVYVTQDRAISGYYVLRDRGCSLVDAS